jgi:DNA invertase Pin-like site-specific DNA recombinase
MKVIGYARVSTEEQAREGVSLEAQEAKLRAYAELYELDLVEVVVDAGYSAKTLVRPGLQTVLTGLEAGRAGGLLVAKLDRLTRSVRDFSTLLETYFKSRFTLLSVADQVDTRSASGRLMLNLLTSMAEWERETIGERTAAALAHKKAQGAKLGAPSLEHPQTLARMLELKASGMTYRAVCQALTSEGFPTLKGGAWRPGTVKRILDRLEARRCL